MDSSRVANRARLRRSRLAPSVTALAGLLLLVACSGPEAPDHEAGEAGSSHPSELGPSAAPESAATPEDSGSPSEHPEESEPGTFTILSAGDVLPHDNVLDAAEAAAEDSRGDEGGAEGGGETPPGEAEYDFAHLMSGVEDWVSGADLALCSLEVPLVPEGEEPSGYPIFGAPPELITGLQQTGFHGCNTATNHSLDRGTDGLIRTLDVLDDHGMGHAGTARTEEEAAQPQFYTLERGGREITVAHLATTTIHNDPFYPPADEPWVVSDLDPEELTSLAGQAREEGADVVVASIHWGDEYVHEPTQAQSEYADALAEGGEIDLVYGNHSHTPQPIENLGGGPGEEGMWVVWSMGNFLSNQDGICCVRETATGTMAIATVEAPDDAEPRVTDVEWAPVTVDRGPSDADGHRGIWPLDDLVEGHRPEGLALSEETLLRRHDRVIEVMGEDGHTTTPPEPTGPEPSVAPRQP